MYFELLRAEKENFSDSSHTELRIQKNTSCGVSINNGNITSNTRSTASGVSARVVRNGMCGFASAAEINGENLRRVVERAEKNAEFMNEKTGVTGENPATAGTGFYDCGEELTSVGQKIYLDFAKEVDSYIAKKYPGLSRRGVSVRCDSMEKYSVTSDGYDAHTLLPRSYVYISLETQSRNAGPVDLFVPVGGVGVFTENFRNTDGVFSEIDKLYEKLMLKKEGVYASAGLKTCILGGSLSGMLAHEAVGHTVEADLVLGGSVALHNLGKQVASPLVNLVDFANTAYGKPAPLPVYVDDEGTPCRDVEIIRNGVLVGYMNNLDSARHFGMEPLGNARAYQYSDEPLIRMRNTAILKGESRLEDMIASVDDGYYLTDTNNGQADTTGEFMFGICMGYEIKNGKLGSAILDTTISGVAFDMLKTVDMVGDEMEWQSSGFCGKKQLMPVGLGGPAIRCKVTMGGR